MPDGTADSATPGAAVGDELMRLVAQARLADADPEFELRAAARRFAERVRDWERSRRG
jgi:XTP/dITP diphosphohydrolase